MNTSTTQPLVLHVAVDYPNTYRPENTLAVRNFVKANEALDHLVVALTRTANPFATGVQEGDGKGDANVISMRYWGLPFGVLLAFSMWIVALRVRTQIQKRHIKPDMVHAHKLTFEGIAGWWLAKWLEVPLVLSVRGEAESKILKFKPHYRPLLQRIMNDATRIYFVSAWFKPLLNARFKVTETKQYLLPNFVAERKQPALVTPRKDHLVTILDLNVYRKKGLDRLLPAFKACLTTFPSARLDIIGRGSEAIRLEVESLIASLGLTQSVKLIGAMPNHELQAQLPYYAGMALPSHNETFGMVYVEALLAGVPILYSKGTGIDGFIDFVEASVSVDPTDHTSIHSGMHELLSNQSEYKNWINSNLSKIQKYFSTKNYLPIYSDLAHMRTQEKIFHAK